MNLDKLKNEISLYPEPACYPSSILPEALSIRFFKITYSRSGLELHRYLQIKNVWFTTIKFSIFPRLDLHKRKIYPGKCNPYQL